MHSFLFTVDLSLWTTRTGVRWSASQTPVPALRWWKPITSYLVYGEGVASDQLQGTHGHLTMTRSSDLLADVNQLAFIFTNQIEAILQNPLGVFEHGRLDKKMFWREHCEIVRFCLNKTRFNKYFDRQVLFFCWRVNVWHVCVVPVSIHMCLHYLSKIYSMS